MTTLNLIFIIIFAILLIVAVITIFKYPKQTLINLPLGLIQAIMKSRLGVPIYFLILLTSPIWICSLIIQKIKPNSITEKINMFYKRIWNFDYY